MLNAKKKSQRRAMQLKTTDNKGRIMLGSSFANVPMSVEATATGEWVVRMVVTIPAREAWLYKNKEALNLVTSGIMEAQTGDSVEDPRTGKDYSWLEEVDDEEIPAEVAKPRARHV